MPVGGWGVAQGIFKDAFEEQVSLAFWSCPQGCVLLASRETPHSFQFGSIPEGGALGVLRKRLSFCIFHETRTPTSF